ncbi:MarR family transcriptional regulator [Saccharicrinis fermentans]|uniref:MarR family transcriptional regulator n=1 Tax=Saccharicrinis fermentans TaxID=982 RepID=UPI0004B3E390
MNYQATLSEIKNFLNLNSSTVSGIIKRLEKKGFLPDFQNQEIKELLQLPLPQQAISH